MGQLKMHAGELAGQKSDMGTSIGCHDFDHMGARQV
jgi:hypothetical protein